MPCLFLMHVCLQPHTNKTINHKLYNFDPACRKQPCSSSSSILCRSFPLSPLFFFNIFILRYYPHFFHIHLKSQIFLQINMHYVMHTNFEELRLKKKKVKLCFGPKETTISASTSCYVKSIN